MKVITDLPFLDAFCRAWLQPSGFSAADGQLRTLHGQFLNLLQEGATVHCLGLGPNLTAYNNPLLLQLNVLNRLRAWKGGHLGTAEDIVRYAARNEMALFCLGTLSDQACQQASKESGYWALAKPPDTIGFFDNQVVTYDRKEAKSWDFAAALFQPHHALVIADPYMYNVKGAQGLLALLKRIKPQCLGYPYWISLVSSDSRRAYSSGLFQPNQIQQLIGDIEAIFHQAAVPFRIEAFVYNGSEFHDRYILTNNLCVLPGYGVSIVKDGKEVPAKEGTWTAAKPFSRVVYNGQQGVYYEKVMQEKLGTIRHWIRKGGGEEENPLMA